ncbi:MAG: Yip1 family protein [Gemmatimonadaceae bacterium]
MTGLDGSIDTHGPDKQALIARVKGILLSPKSEWPVIDRESTTVAQLYAGYIAVLSAIPPLASFIGYSVFGISIPFVGTYRIPMGSALTSAITQYVLGLVGCYVLALVIDALAPTFAGEKNLIQALKVSAYSATASWLAGIFALIPGLRFLSILGLYSLYLLYLGLPTLMKSPKEKAMGYTVVVIVCAIVIFWGIAVIGGMFISRPAMPGLG